MTVNTFLKQWDFELSGTEVVELVQLNLFKTGKPNCNISKRVAEKGLNDARGDLEIRSINIDNEAKVMVLIAG